MDRIVTEFFNNNSYIEHNKNVLPVPNEFKDLSKDETVKKFFKWIRHESKCNSLKYDINADVSEIQDEIKSNSFLAISHRESLGWKSITLYGYSSIMTNSYEYYKQQGFISDDDTTDWTDVVRFFPKTVSWIKKHNPLASYARIRIMVLDPGGHSTPHKDYQAGQALCGPINIAVINPPGAEFVLEGGGLVPWQEGDFRSMDIGSYHCIRNNSDTPRIHLIITPSRNDWDIDAMRMACRSFLKYHG